MHSLSFRNVKSQQCGKSRIYSYSYSINRKAAPSTTRIRVTLFDNMGRDIVGYIVHVHKGSVHYRH